MIKKALSFNRAALVLCITISLGLWAAQKAARAADRILPGTNVIAGNGEVCSGTNLLENPSFEGDYPVYIMAPPGHPDCQTWSPDEPNQYCERVKLADSWHPYWLDTPRNEPWDNIQPEYVPSFPAEIPSRVRSGEKSQHYFSFWSTHEAGVYQQVEVIPNGEYCFSVWGQAWSARETLPGFISDPDDHGELYQRVGIDPTGGTDWGSPNVIWGEQRMQYDLFGLFTVSAVATAETITVFTWSRPNIPVKHNDVYWDDAMLTLAQYNGVTPSSLAAMVDQDLATTVTRTVQISTAESIGWTAELQPGGTITPTLSVNSGTGSGDLDLIVASAGLSPGSYQATVTVTFTPDYLNEPRQITLQLFVVEEIYPHYLPLTGR
jgi:hypothetical protein